MEKRGLSFSYDKRADVLYISVGKPKKAISREIQDGILIRFEPKTKRIVGLTIIDFTARFKTTKTKSIPITLEAELQTV